MDNVLGLQKSIVKLSPHQAAWAALYEVEKQLFLDTFGDVILGIEHVGSTAILNIPAKPVIDMQVGVASLDVALAMKEKFKTISYEHRPNQNRPEELYVKGTPYKHTHYVHVVVYDEQQWREVIKFRDCMRNDADLAQEYATLKRELPKKYADNRRLYTDSKDEFIKRALASCE